MTRTIPLSTAVGEVMAPQTLVTALVIGPDGSVRVDAGALHGRSEVEGQLTWVPQRAQLDGGQPCWVVWVAVELDQANAPVRYQGLSVSEWVVNLQKRIGYKSLADQVNRLSEAMRGGVNVSRLSPDARGAVKGQLASMAPEAWERSPASLREALG